VFAFDTVGRRKLPPRNTYKQTMGTRFTRCINSARTASVEPSSIDQTTPLEERIESLEHQLHRIMQKCQAQSSLIRVKNRRIRELVYYIEYPYNTSGTQEYPVSPMPEIL
jgi:hypothetical protein